MLGDLTNKLEATTIDQRTKFYAMLAHEITMEVRAVWSEDRLSAEQQVSGMKSLNELQHRIAGKILNLLRGDESWTDKDFVHLLQDHVQTERTGNLVRHAIQKACVRSSLSEELE